MKKLNELKEFQLKSLDFQGGKSGVQRSSSSVVYDAGGTSHGESDDAGGTHRDMGKDTGCTNYYRN